MSTLQEIEAAILGLSEQDRLHLADKILRSLPKPPGAMESEEILAKAIRRDQELENGVIEPLTEEAFWAGVAARRCMKLEFHPAVRQDFIQARDYYQTEGGPHLADRFEREIPGMLIGYSSSTKSVPVLPRL